MPERRAIIGSRVGLHARPAALFVRQAVQQPMPVTIARPGSEPVNARSILAVLGLGARGGEQVVLSAEGPGAEASLDELVAFLAVDNDEPAG